MSYLWVAGLSGSAVLAAQDGLEADVHNASGVNCNLSALATCLAVRCQGRADVPWSDSPLTCLLKVSPVNFGWTHCMLEPSVFCDSRFGVCCKAYLLSSRRRLICMVCILAQA